MSLTSEVIRIINQYIARGKKIAELPSIGSVNPSDLLEVSQGGVSYKALASQVGAGGSGIVQTIVAGTNITVDSTDPANPIVSATGGGGTVTSVNTGSGITVDNTDAANPIVNLGGETVGSGTFIFPDVDDTQVYVIGADGGDSKRVNGINILSRGYVQVASTTGGGDTLDMTISPGSGGVTFTASGSTPKGFQVSGFDAVSLGTYTGIADSIYARDAAGLLINIPNGADTEVLTMVSGAPAWAAAGGGTTYTFASPLNESAGSVTIADAAADGTTKGAAAFTAADFNSSSGVISIDYTNGQAASGSTKGFLTSADWTTFDSKQAAISFGTGVLTFLGTPSWTNFNSMITGTAPFWSLASGGTLTGVNTMTSNTANQLIFAGTYTTTANNQYYLAYTATITARGTASDNIYGIQISPSIVYGANDQTGTAIFVNVTTTPGAFTGLNSNFALFQAAGTTVYEINANGTVFFGSAVSNRPRIAISNTSGSASVSGITLRVGGSWTNAASVCTYITTGNTSFTSTGTFEGRMVEIAFPSFSPSSGAYSPTGISITGSISPSGSYTGTTRIFDVNLTGTRSVGTGHYGITIRNTDLLNGFAVSAPTAVVHLGPVLAARASLRIEAGATTTAPSSPNSGDVWHEGTGNRLMFRQGGTSMEIIGTSSVNAVSPTAPNRTLTVLIGNTTYYIHCKTTND